MDEKWPESTTRRYVNGAAVQALREALGISQARFARDCLISPSYLCRVEWGEKQPSMQIVRRMLVQLACSIDAITVLSTVPPPKREKPKRQPKPVSA